MLSHYSIQSKVKNKDLTPIYFAFVLYSLTCNPQPVTCTNVFQYSIIPLFHLFFVECCDLTPITSFYEFMEFHFEARYPDANKAFYKKCTKPYTAKKLKEIKEVFTWVRAKL